jgi:peptide-methionine (R)-S-oxide reductase
MARRVQKSDAEWRASLTPEQYYVTRQAGTERPFTGQYWKNVDRGTYACVCCGTTLFTSDAKFTSHCGWPSFDRCEDGDVVERIVDKSHGMVRVEVVCSSCGAHLGHVFDDGPTETGERYCINSVSIVLQPAGGGSD